MYEYIYIYITGGSYRAKTAKIITCDQAKKCL